MLNVGPITPCGAPEAAVELLSIVRLLRPCEASEVPVELFSIDGTINAATVAENKPHYSFRVDGDAAWW